MTKTKKISPTRRRYWFKFAFRLTVFIVGTLLCILKPEVLNLDVLKGMNFFKTFSPLHLLWAYWVFDMLSQIFPINNKLALGSRKHFAKNYQPTKTVNKELLAKYMKKQNKKALIIMVVWCSFVAVGTTLYYTGIIDERVLLAEALFFYLSDLICVLIWCPFCLFMNNRCCSSCRIFNWDHFFMFSQIVFIGGFFSVSLFALAMVVFIMWEITLIRHPERFWEGTNCTLHCSNCTDRLSARCLERRVKTKVSSHTMAQENK